MAWLERCAGAALLIAGLAHADPPSYGKVETFQPGKKYNCVPTADHKAWDCNESGKANEPRAETAAPPAAPASLSPEATPKASALPSYLTNAAVRSPPRAAAPAQTHAPAPVQASIPTPVPEPARTPVPAPARTPEPVAAQPVEPPAASPVPAIPAPVPTPPPAPAAPTPSAATTASLGNREFLALPAGSYVVEIAHGANREALSELHASLHLPLGELYELHMTRGGGDWWLLVWGHFSDIESARAARSDLPTDAAVNAGWPRRIAPLQAEARKSGE